VLCRINNFISYNLSSFFHTLVTQGNNKKPAHKQNLFLFSAPLRKASRAASGERCDRRKLREAMTGASSQVGPSGAQLSQAGWIELASARSAAWSAQSRNGACKRHLWQAETFSRSDSIRSNPKQPSVKDRRKKNGKSHSSNRRKAKKKLQHPKARVRNPIS